MRRVLEGSPAAEGIALGRVHVVNWGVPKVPHRMVDVSEVPGKPGVYRAVAFLKPHFQLDELTMSMRLVAELPTGK